MNPTTVTALALCLFACLGNVVDCQECIKGQLDVLFVLDSSSSVSTDDFSKGLGFAANLAENFQIGPKGVQFGTVTFADSPHNLFNLDTYQEYTSLEKAILGGTYLSGNTSTGLALETVQNLYDVSHGGRPGAPNVAIVFTNGKSGDFLRTQQQAQNLKNSGVYVIAVGFSDVNNQELQAIASDPSAVLNINNFSGVLTLLQNYSNNACSRQECIKGQLDVLFVLDSSSSVSISDFSKGLGFAANLAENFQIGPKNVQFGTLTFSDSPHNLFNLNAYAEYTSLEKAILSGAYLSGNTSTGLALETVQNLYDVSHGGRPGAPNVAIVFTNGKSVDFLRTQQQAQNLKNSGVYVIAVGFSDVNNQELQAIASDPSAVLNINNFNGVLTVLQNYSNNACNKQPICSRGRLDTVFVVDSSSSVGPENFNHTLRFAANLAENFQTESRDVQFGLITFADTPRPIFDFNTLTNFQDLDKALLNATYQSGIANTFLALQECRNFFNTIHGSRPEAKKLAILFTDGRSSDFTKTTQQASALKNTGVYIIVVGFPGANVAELQSVASEPGAVFDINNLNSILRAVQQYRLSGC